MAASTLLQTLANLLRPELCQQPATIWLRERSHGKEGDLASVTLHKKGPAVVLKLDGFTPRRCSRLNCECTFSADDRFFPLFQAVAGVRAICDYIIFYQWPRERTDASGPLYVFLCELKSRNTGGSGGQIENGKLLADYIISMAKYHGENPVDQRIVYRGLLFSSNVRPPKTAIEHKPVRYENRSRRLADLKLIHYPCGSEWALSHFCDER